MPSIITAGDATNGAAIVQGGNDGALKIQTGPAGGKVDALTADAAGQVSLLKTPNVSTAQSMVRLNTANGYGSTNTVIRRFTNVVTNQGTDITYADSATLGASFTINTSGVYAISYTDSWAATSDVFGASKNSAQLTTAFSSITIADALCSAGTSGANAINTASTAVYLAAGDVIRPHAAGTAVGSPNRSQFTITRVA